MASFRIWYQPDGTVAITAFLVDELRDRDCATLLRDGHVKAGSTFEDHADRASLEAVLPADKSSRKEWTKNDKGAGVVVGSKKTGG